MPVVLGGHCLFRCPKTASAAAQDAMLRAGGINVPGGHDFTSMHRGLVKQYRTIATIREPCARYGSLYVHANSTQKDPLKKWGGGSTAFKNVLYGWTHPTRKRMPDKRLGCIWSPGPPRSLLEHGGGLYTWEVSQVYGDDIDTYISSDHLAAGFAAVGLRVNVKVVNTRVGRSGEDKIPPYEKLYDDEMIRWVYEAEADLVERFGFEPFKPTTWVTLDGRSMTR